MILWTLGVLCFTVFLARFLWDMELAAQQTGLGLKQALASLESPLVAEPGKASLMHCNGLAQAREESLTDPDFDVNVKSALRLARRVEMYQWVEKREVMRSSNRPGRKMVWYEKAWECGRRYSQDFRFPQGHENPEPAWPGIVVDAEVFVGERRISRELLKDLDDWEPLSLEHCEPAPGFERVGTYFVQGDLGHPEIGDLRIYFEKVGSPVQVSVLGQLSEADTLEPWTSPAGTQIGKVFRGQHTAGSMLKQLLGDAQRDVSTGYTIFLLANWATLLLALGPNSEVLYKLETARWLMRHLGHVLALGVTTLAMSAALVMSVVLLTRIRFWISTMNIRSLS